MDTSADLTAQSAGDVSDPSHGDLLHHMEALLQTGPQTETVTDVPFDPLGLPPHSPGASDCDTSLSDDDVLPHDDDDDDGDDEEGEVELQENGRVVDDRQLVQAGPPQLTNRGSANVSPRERHLPEERVHQPRLSPGRQYAIGDPSEGISHPGMPQFVYVQSTSPSTAQVQDEDGESGPEASNFAKRGPEASNFAQRGPEASNFAQRGPEASNLEEVGPGASNVGESRPWRSSRAEVTAMDSVKALGNPYECEFKGKRWKFLRRIEDPADFPSDLPAEEYTKCGQKVCVNRGPGMKTCKIVETGEVFLIVFENENKEDGVIEAPGADLEHVITDMQRKLQQLELSRAEQRENRISCSSGEPGDQQYSLPPGRPREASVASVGSDSGGEGRKRFRIPRNPGIEPDSACPSENYFPNLGINESKGSDARGREDGVTRGAQSKGLDGGNKVLPSSGAGASTVPPSEGRGGSKVLPPGDAGWTGEEGRGAASADLGAAPPVIGGGDGNTEVPPMQQVLAGASQEEMQQQWASLLQALQTQHEKQMADMWKQHQTSVTQIEYQIRADLSQYLEDQSPTRASSEAHPPRPAGQPQYPPQPQQSSHRKISQPSDRTEMGQASKVGQVKAREVGQGKTSYYTPPQSQSGFKAGQSDLQTQQQHLGHGKTPPQKQRPDVLSEFVVTGAEGENEATPPHFYEGRARSVKRQLSFPGASESPDQSRAHPPKPPTDGFTEVGETTVDEELLRALLAPHESRNDTRSDLQGDSKVFVAPPMAAAGTKDSELGAVGFAVDDLRTMVERRRDVRRYDDSGEPHHEPSRSAAPDSGIPETIRPGARPKKKSVNGTRDVPRPRSGKSPVRRLEGPLDSETSFLDPSHEAFTSFRLSHDSLQADLAREMRGSDPYRLVGVSDRKHPDLDTSRTTNQSMTISDRIAASASSARGEQARPAYPALPDPEQFTGPSLYLLRAGGGDMGDPDVQTGRGAPPASRKVAMSADGARKEGAMPPPPQGFVDPRRSVSASAASADRLQQLRDKHERHLEDMRVYYEGEMQSLKQQYDTEVEEVRQALAQAGNISQHDQSTVSAEAYGALQGRWQASQQQLSSVSESISELRGHNSSLETQVSEWASRYSRKEEECGRLQGQFAQVASLLQERDRQSDEMERRNQQLMTAVDESYKLAEAKGETYRKEQQLLQKLLREYETLAREHEATKSTLNLTENRLHDAKTELAETKRQLNNMTLEIKRIERENNLLCYRVRASQDHTLQNVNGFDRHDVRSSQQHNVLCPERGVGVGRQNGQQVSSAVKKNGGNDYKPAMDYDEETSASEGWGADLVSPLLRAENVLRTSQAAPPARPSSQGPALSKKSPRNRAGALQKSVATSSPRDKVRKTSNLVSVSPEVTLNPQRAHMARPKGTPSPRDVMNGSQGSQGSSGGASGYSGGADVGTETEHAGDVGLSLDSALQRVWKGSNNRMSGDYQQANGSNKPSDTVMAVKSVAALGGAMNRATIQQQLDFITGLQDRMDFLQRQKTKLQSELSRVPSGGIKHRQLEEELERELDTVNQELGSVRMSLKRLHVLKGST